MWIKGIPTHAGNWHVRLNDKTQNLVRVGQYNDGELFFTNFGDIHVFSINKMKDFVKFSKQCIDPEFKTPYYPEIELRATFMKNLMNEVERYKLDGYEPDWNTFQTNGCYQVTCQRDSSKD